MERMISFVAGVTACCLAVAAHAADQPAEAKAAEPEASPAAAAPTDSPHYEQLKELEWMVGEWVDQGEDATITTVCRWTKNRNFMTRSFKVVTADDRVLEGTQVIGWDPADKRIRSWLFDSEGGFGEGRWSRDGNRWIVKASQVLKSGGRASAINVITYVDDNTLTWQSTGREVDGEMLPDVPEVTVVRKQSQ